MYKFEFVVQVPQNKPSSLTSATMRPQSKSPDEELHLAATIPVADLGASRHPQDLVAQPRSKSTGEGEAEPGHRDHCYEPTCFGRPTGLYGLIEFD
jgi:hypothetical protein